MKNVKIILIIACTLYTFKSARAQSTEQLDNLYRLTISFYSTAGGSDHESIEKLKQYIEHYNETHKIKLSHELTPWGREGEVDFCINMKGLKNAYQKKLVTQMRELLKKGENIRFEENKPCLHAKKLSTN